MRGKLSTEVKQVPTFTMIGIITVKLTEAQTVRRMLAEGKAS